MTRASIAITVVSAVVTAASTAPAFAQRGAAPAAAPAPAAPAQPAPRMSDGKPDLSGVWWTGGDVGGRGYGGGRGRGRGAGPPPQTFTGLYNPATAEAAKKLNDDHDPTFTDLLYRFWNTDKW